MKKLFFIFIAVLILSSCELIDLMELAEPPVKYETVKLTDEKVTGKWFNSRAYDDYGYGESGYAYTLTINADGTYSQRSQSYTSYGSYTKFGVDSVSSITITKIEYTKMNMLGEPGIRINNKHTYIKYGK